MKTLAALFLASLLAVMAYGIFWLVCVTYTTNQMDSAIQEALGGAELTRGTASWMPDYGHVTMELPSARLTIPNGPVREIRASSLVLSTGFLMRDRWTVKLPQTVEVTLANGGKLLLETTDGQVMWVKDGGRFSLRASSLRLLDLNGNELAQLGDVMLERKAYDVGVRLNLASRPKLASGPAVLSGQVVLTSDAFGRVVNLYGDHIPDMGTILRAVVASLMEKGGSLQLDNVSFKLATGASGAVFGTVQVLSDGRMTGNLAVTADSSARALGWITQTGLLASPRGAAENQGVTRFMNSLGGAKTMIRMENMQDSLMMNGFAVGPLPKAQDVVSRLWGNV